INKGVASRVEVEMGRGKRQKRHGRISEALRNYERLRHRIKKLCVLNISDNKKKHGEKGKKHGGEDNKKLVEGKSERFSSKENKKRTQQMCILYQTNTDGSIGLLFGRAIETYILLLPIKKGTCFKYQSWQKLNQAIRRGLVNLKCEEEEDQKYVTQIQQELVSDLCVWHWVFYCASNGNCQRACAPFNGMPKEQLEQQEQYGTNIFEDCGNWCTPIEFKLSNKKNMHTIRLVVEAIKANIP
ncbi:4471_t:CDS:2, partial [Gigaspora rosea]